MSASGATAEGTRGGLEPPLASGAFSTTPRGGVAAITGAVGGTVITKLGSADGGCTFDSKFPLALGTLVTETPGEGNSDVDDDILLRDSENLIKVGL